MCVWVCVCIYGYVYANEDALCVRVGQKGGSIYLLGWKYLERMWPAQTADILKVTLRGV